jgi:hypothetical protein
MITLKFVGKSPAHAGWMAHIRINNRVIAIRRDRLADAITDAVDLIKNLTQAKQ